MTESNKNPLRRTVLLVEDQVVVRMIISDYLRQCDFKVIEAANADEALIVLRQLDIAIDILFCQVPVAGSLAGFSLARWTRENRPGIIVKLTGTPRRAAMAAVELCDSDPGKRLPGAQSLTDRMSRLMALRNGTRPTSARGRERFAG